MIRRPSLDKIKTVTVTDVQRKVGLITQDVAINRERVIVERNGYPVAAIIPMSDLKILIDRAANEQKAT